MTPVTVIVALAALNAVLALVLAGVYARNHAELRSPLTLGLLLFAAFLLVHNGLVVYHYVTMMGIYFAEQGLVVAETALQTAALAALLWASMR